MQTLTSISFSKKAGGRLARSLYVFLHNASAGPRGAWGARALPPPPEEAVTVLKIAHYMILRVYTVIWWRFGVLWVVSMDRTTAMLDLSGNQNSQTSLPRAIGSPTDSRTVLLRAVGLPTLFGTLLVGRQRIKIA